ncbi:MAG TPA: DUF1592 domain-containing protein [Thermoguttaceae bacterium]|nr:DUF1592 domain-containing protein [Thermoguttaceae bacterium]
MKLAWPGIFSSIVASMLLTSTHVFSQEASGPESSTDALQQVVRPFFERHCFGCHEGSDAEADLRLDTLADSPPVARDGEAWKKWNRVLQRVGSGEMPPKPLPRPDKVELDRVVAWLQKSMQTAAADSADPGKVTIRRLNRAEYANTVRDLLGVEFKADEQFPADDVGYGFDNIGDVLSLSPLLMEKYLAAADGISQEALDSLSRARWIAVEPKVGATLHDAVRDVLQPLLMRAYRRPVTEQEVDRLVRLAETVGVEDASFDESVRLALKAILVSPHFLFKVELGPNPDGSEEVRLLSEFELATRLSYFLWSTMPDEELFARASAGKLRADLDAQIDRMLDDSKRDALVKNFAGQWLELRNLSSVAPDGQLFPSFDDRLRNDMRTETEMFFAAILSEDRSVLEMIDADYSFVNGRLAKHYGIAGVDAGEEFRRVSLDGTPRGGIIMQASILTVTSNPTRTSPVKRGKWILENILGEPPPPPPADVPDLNEDEQAVLSGSLRQRMEQHRKDPRCAVCHVKMDAMGFAMENFDAVGAWRTKDGQFTIDPAGQFPDGQSFRGPAELKRILREGSKDQFARCLTEKMLTYALGRGIEPSDETAVNEIVESLAEQDYRFSALIKGIARSDPFQKQRRTRSSP